MEVLLLMEQLVQVKLLSSLDITSSSTQVNGSAIITTGAQNYSSNLTVNSSSSNPMPDVTLQGTGLTAHGPITVYGGSNIYLNSNITTTDDLWLSATSINAGGSERTVQAGSGDVRITANSVANGGITITSTTGAFIYEPKLTNWDYIEELLNVTGTLSSNNYTGGSDVAWLKIQGVSGLTGLQFGKVGNTSGVWLQHLGRLMVQSIFMGQVLLSAKILTLEVQEHQEIFY